MSSCPLLYVVMYYWVTGTREHCHTWNKRSLAMLNVLCYKDAFIVEDRLEETVICYIHACMNRWVKSNETTPRQIVTYLWKFSKDFSCIFHNFLRRNKYRYLYIVVLSNISISYFLLASVCMLYWPIGCVLCVCSCSYVWIALIELCLLFPCREARDNIRYPFPDWVEQWSCNHRYVHKF